MGDEGILIVKGEYRYVLDDKEYVVTYTADKDGYHPKVTISDYTLPPPVSMKYIHRYYSYAAPSRVGRFGFNFVRKCE